MGYGSFQHLDYAWYLRQQEWADPAIMASNKTQIAQSSCANVDSWV